MNAQIEQSVVLMVDPSVKLEVVYADQGYQGEDKNNPEIEIKHRGKDKRMKDEKPSLLKRGLAIEPIIGSLKAGHWMSRCHLKG